MCIFIYLMLEYSKIKLKCHKYNVLWGNITMLLWHVAMTNPNFLQTTPEKKSKPNAKILHSEA